MTLSQSGFMTTSFLVQMCLYKWLFINKRTEAALGLTFNHGDDDVTDCWDSEDRAGSGDITRDDAIVCMSNSTAMIFKFHHHSDLNFYLSEKLTEPSGGIYISTHWWKGEVYSDLCECECASIHITCRQKWCMSTLHKGCVSQSLGLKSSRVKIVYGLPKVINLPSQWKLIGLNLLVAQWICICPTLLSLCQSYRPDSLASSQQWAAQWLQCVIIFSCLSECLSFTVREDVLALWPVSHSDLW